MKKIALSLVALGLLTALPGFAATPAPLPAAIANHDGPIRIAVIRNLGSDDNTTQFIAGAIQEGKKLGFKVSTFLSNGDDAKFQDFVNQAISQKYDGIILSQGRDPYSTALVKKAVDAGIKVSVFDTAVNGEIPGVTVTQQDDASLTNLSFGQLAKDFNGKANIVKLWVAGFPPMERRQAAYKVLQKQYPDIKELESIGAVSSDVQGDTANKVGAILAKYPKGKIDAIWGTWDAFSQGAYKALKENGRTEIKLYSIDISNQDLQLMREPGSSWKVSVAVDPKLIGATNVRLVANKIAGEATPATYDFKAAAIPQALLTAQPGAVNVASLGKIIPGWGQTEDFIAPWFAYIGHMVSQGFSIVDVRDPKNPKAAGYVPAPPGTWNVHLQAHDDLLLVINARDLFADARFADEKVYYTRQVGETVSDVQGKGWSAGLRVFDISTPDKPREIGFLSLSGIGIHRIWYVGGRWAYVSALIDGFTDYIFLTIDLADPRKPEVAGRWWLPA